MNREELFAYAKETFGTEPDYPWARYPDFAVLRHQPSRKWYGLAMKLSADKLGIDSDEMIEVLNVKLNPDDVLALRLADDIMPAYHMNKKNWISIRIDGGIPDDLIKGLLAESFALTN